MLTFVYNTIWEEDKVHRYKLAVIGCGNVAHLHAEAYARHQQRVEVIASCDPLIERAREFAQQFPGCKPYESIGEAARECDWEVGVVCSPTPFHLEVVEELVQFRKHAFVEKPMTDNLRDARRMVTLCAEADVQLAVHQNFRYHYPFDLARSLIRAGHIGHVQTIAHRELMFRKDRGWRTSTTRHALAVMGIHWLDGFRWMLDDEPVSVLCELASSPLVGVHGETDAVMQARFAKGTIVSYVESFSSADSSLETNVIGDQGTLRLNHTELREWGVQIGKSQQAEVVYPNPSGSDKPLATFASLDQFLQALDSNTPANNSGQDNLRTVAFLTAAYRSAELGRVVNLEEELCELVP